MSTLQISGAPMVVGVGCVPLSPVGNMQACLEVGKGSLLADWHQIRTLPTFKLARHGPSNVHVAMAQLI
eukprot:357415-Chlamydomonas_euryale.AAC.9